MNKLKSNFPLYSLVASTIFLTSSILGGLLINNNFFLILIVIGFYLSPIILMILIYINFSNTRTDRTYIISSFIINLGLFLFALYSVSHIF